MDLPGISDEERYDALRKWTKSNANRIVEQFVYESDRSIALKSALDELAFNYKPGPGDAEEGLTKVLSGREVRQDNLEDTQALMWELAELTRNAKGLGDESFLSLKSTVHQIVDKRCNKGMKQKFAKATERANEAGERIDVQFLLDFVRKWFKSLDNSFGMASYKKDKAATALSPPQIHSKVGVAAVAASGQGQLNPQAQSFSPTQCFYCGLDHSHLDCLQFKQLDYAQKKDALFQKRRCFRCCSDEHGARNCKTQLKCDICQKTNHITLLHRDPFSLTAAQSTAIHVRVVKWSNFGQEHLK